MHCEQAASPGKSERAGATVAKDREMNEKRDGSSAIKPTAVHTNLPRKLLHLNAVQSSYCEVSSGASAAAAGARAGDLIFQIIQDIGSEIWKAALEQSSSTFFISRVLGLHDLKKCNQTVVISMQQAQPLMRGLGGCEHRVTAHTHTVWRWGIIMTHIESQSHAGDAGGKLKHQKGVTEQFKSVLMNRVLCDVGCRSGSWLRGQFNHRQRCCCRRCRQIGGGMRSMLEREL